eukprot:10045634-Karenia_brevis.AAC.1
MRAAVSEPGLHKLLSGSAPSKAKMQASATTRRVWSTSTHPTAMDVYTRQNMLCVCCPRTCSAMRR